MAVIDRLLSPGGLLFVGHAESLQPINRGYSPVRFPFGFAYRKHVQVGERKTSRHPERRPQCQNARTADGPSVRPHPKTGEPQHRPAPAGSTDPLALAFAMADQGRTDEARKLCEAALALRPPPADAYYLLGLLQEAHGLAAEAERCLQKAVYLEPDHVQALAHLALNAQWRGDAKAAELFRQRARRAEAKQARH